MGIVADVNRVSCGRFGRFVKESRACQRVAARWILVVFVAQCCMRIGGRRAAVVADASHGCGSNLDGSITSLPFCNTSIPISERCQDLVSRLSLEEKVAQLVNEAPAVSRLGIPSHEWWNEALHGVAESPGVSFTETVTGATSFPQPILTAASFNSALWTMVAQAISTEGRAMHNLGQSGLTYWAPNINVFRDPRWGRGQETPGEDPLLSSIYSSVFVRGMQEINYPDEGSDFTTPYGEASRKVAGDPARDPALGSMLKTSVCCKHFTAYDLESWNGSDRYHFDAEVSQQDLEDTYNRPFQSCVQEGQASSVMCSYNRVNGIPTCADFNLLTGTAREKWGLNGYIVSDCDAVSLIYNAVEYVATGEDATASVYNAGMDLNCGTTAGTFGQSAVAQGKLNETVIDNALVNLFMVRMRLGEFDGNPKYQIYGSLGESNICSAEHQDLAEEAAAQGIVLLKNANNALPLLLGNIQSLAVIGPNANATITMLGNYAGTPCKYITPLAGIQKYVNSVRFEAGCDDVICESDAAFDTAIQVADGPDATVIVVGLDQTQEKETLDRVALRLPGQQENLVNAAANSSSGPVVLVVMCGGPVDITFAKKNPNVDSIIWIGYPGQSGGQALADIIFGHRNPGGRLPVTWYPELYTQISMLNMNMKPDPASNYPGRTYRYYTGETVFEFGDGLSYTNFSHTHTSAPTEVMIPSFQQQKCFQHPHMRAECAAVSAATAEGEATCDNQSFHVKVLVKNEGVRRGTDVVLLYAVPPNSGVDGAPLKQLVGFHRVSLDAYTQVEVGFQVLPCKHLATFGKNGIRELTEGVHSFIIGNQKTAHCVAFVSPQKP